MKKQILGSILFLCIISRTFGQIAYYDAIELRKLNPVPDSGKIIFQPSISTKAAEILKKYTNKTTYGGIQASFNENAFIFLPVLKEQSSNKINNLPNSLIENIGSLNVTNFADGLAQFLIQRSKEELNVAFFRRFQEYLQKYPEVQIVFPVTTNFLNQVYSYQYASMLPALKAAFQNDLNAFSTNLLNLRDKSNYAGYNTNEEIKKRADEIIKQFNSPEGLMVAGALLVTNRIVKGDNVAEIISALAADDICINHRGENFSNLVQLVNLISQSLRSTEEDRVWITKQQLHDLVDDEITLKIYLGLVYAVNQKNKSQISFKTQDVPYSLQDFLKTLSHSWDSDEAAKFKESYTRLANSMVEAADNAKNIVEAKKQGDQASILVYADYASSIASLFKQSVTFLSSNSKLNKYAPEMLKFATVIDDATNACYDLKSQNYTALVLHTSSILSEILGSGYTHKDQFLKYGVFMANVVEAKSSKEVNAAIEAAVLPVGSSSIKRETNFNVSLNAYIGPYGGFEYMPMLKQNRWAPTVGLTAPVGVAVSFGNIGKGPKECNCKRPGGKSITLFVPLIDVGSVASFRLGNDSTRIASKITLSNIIAPGFYIYYGFGKSPFSIGIGGQLGPQLREVTATSDLNIDKNYYLRFGFNLVVDIPFFNLYTNN